MVFLCVGSVISVRGIFLQTRVEKEGEIRKKWLARRSSPTRNREKEATGQ